MARLIATGGIILLSTIAWGQNAQALEAVTFAESSGTLYVPARPLAGAFGWTIQWDAADQALYLNNQRISSPESVKRLPDGTVLISVGSLRYLGATVSWNAENETATIKSGAALLSIVRGDKRVEVDRTQQKLRAWQGNLLVLETAVSTGSSGKRTPTGSYTAGPYKARMHYSSLYDDAPMPYSVQVNGNVFIHGFSSVPDYPASHGCIRMPLDGTNPARWFYEWVDPGTPIQIIGRWEG